MTGSRETERRPRARRDALPPECAAARRRRALRDRLAGLARLDARRATGSRRRSASPNYYRTMAFVNAVASIAHREDHHPDLAVHYDRCVVAWSTHSAGGVTLNDLHLRGQDGRRRRVRRAAPPVAPGAGSRERGLVTASRRRHYAVRLDNGETVECVLKGRNTTLACGDRVHVARVAGGGSIESVEPRATLFYRSDAFNEKLIAANVTQVIGVVAPDIAVDEELVNRWIIGAEAQGCRFVLAANKSDQPGLRRASSRGSQPFAALGYAVVPMSAQRDVAPLLPLLRGQRTVLIGQSGMGKTTILNAVAPHVQAKTATISEALSTGRHTTSQSTLYPLPDERRRRLDRRFARAQGVRPRARRARDDRGGVRRDPSAARPLPLSRLPSRSRARLRRVAGRRRGQGGAASRRAPAAARPRKPGGARARALGPRHLVTRCGDRADAASDTAPTAPRSRPTAFRRSIAKTRSGSSRGSDAAARRARKSRSEKASATSASSCRCSARAPSAGTRMT